MKYVTVSLLTNSCLKTNPVSNLVFPVINQLLSITHRILTSFDNELAVRSFVLDISKAFDKVWHKGFILKLKQNDICGELLQILNNFLRNTKQRVVINGLNLPWTNVHAVFLQGSILDPF